ncbi:recombinase family protein [Desulfopila aestuarii]|uniref:Site-specific DNA recombinase n=1 Tax=Desulfopila aestuarii DSM 18488 TaxID=1121416 RepID=A0A1M7YKM3_9BACT|nr:recombinase family protein [Desulfopila aestuarii]SHO53161.1 Site-specific DNA recombinase [Desulfopila aestuarii DSM 18488]
MGKTIRFAPLIRVSTEKQEEQGSSLQTQKEVILKAISTIGGYVPDNCWKYTGQEHATPDFEKQMFTQLLSDASENLFDAVIVYDPSRWSRDNRHSKEGLKILKENGIRFFCGTTEYDLFDPQATLFLGMSTEMNEYFALEQARKSLLSRIARAKNNIPSTGRLPYGRIFDKKTRKWSIDTENQKKITWAAEQYLQGKSMSEIADTLGMNHSSLWNILKNRSGTEWVIEFNNKRLNISETVTLEIPPLLPQEIINAIWQKSDSNKTFEHGHIKNKYLFSRMIFCAECGYAMFGQTNQSGRRYYRHARKRKKECNHGGIYVSADVIEEAVFIKLFALCGDKPKIEQAVKTSSEKYGDHNKLIEEQKILSKELKAIANQKSNLINAVARGDINSDDIKEKMDSLKKQEARLETLIGLNKEKVRSAPSPKEIKQRSEWVKKVILKAAKNTYGRAEHYLKMTWEDKRRLSELIFSGVDLDGERAGVYLKKDENGNLSYEAHGIINAQIHGKLPISKFEIMELLQIDSDDLASQQDLFSKCDAYYCFCFYQ